MMVDPSLVEVLTLACSQPSSAEGANNIKVAEERLRAWENTKGFYNALMVRKRNKY